MDTLTVKLPPQLRARLQQEAKRRSVSQSTIVRDAVQRALGGVAGRKREQSCTDLVRDLIGSVRSGRANLATDKALLEEAMLDDLRGRKRRR
ncbi:MAG: ribbon-helix-helix protein, CopG family [Burkholderiales bacterium]